MSLKENLEWIRGSDLSKQPMRRDASTSTKKPQFNLKLFLLPQREGPFITKRVHRIVLEIFSFLSIISKVCFEISTSSKIIILLTGLWQEKKLFKSRLSWMNNNEELDNAKKSLWEKINLFCFLFFKSWEDPDTSYQKLWSR